MFRTLIYPSSGACDCAVELPHRSFCSQFVVYWRFGAVGLSGIRVAGWSFSLQHGHHSNPPHQISNVAAWSFSLQHGHHSNPPHQISNTKRTENKTTDVIIQQHSRKLLMMDILMSETCWAHKKWNKIASDINLVFYSSTITMMHGPINIRYILMFAIPKYLTHIWIHNLSIKHDKF